MLLYVVGCLLIWLFVNLETLCEKQGLKEGYEPMRRASFSVQFFVRIDEGHGICSVANILSMVYALVVHCIGGRGKLFMRSKD